jgi:hypothetical protein
MLAGYLRRVFLGRDIHGSGFTSPAATGFFYDVLVNYWAVDWIEQHYKEKITVGCMKNSLMYCPARAVRRDIMSVF